MRIVRLHNTIPFCYRNVTGARRHNSSTNSDMARGAGERTLLRRGEGADATADVTYEAA